MRDRKKRLVFENRETVKSKNRVRFAIAFVCFSLLLGAISFLMLLRAYDYDFRNIVRTTESSEESSTEVSESAVQELSGRAVFLFIHISDDGKSVRGIDYIAADLGKKSIGILPLTADRSVTLDGKRTTLQSAFVYGGAEGLMKAAAAAVDFSADKYILMTDAGLINCLKTLGDVKITLPQAIRCKRENLILELPAGEQLLASDTVLRFIKYNLSVYGSEEAAKQNAALLAAAVKTYVDESLASRSEEVFSTLINFVEGDITAVDFAAAKSKVDAFALSQDKGEIAVVGSLQNWQAGATEGSAE